MVHVLQQTRSTNEEIAISYCESSSSTSEHLSGTAEHNTQAVMNTLYLLDRFGVSDQFYHELSMIYPSLEHSYRVKEALTTLNSDVVIHNLPGEKGWYRNVKQSVSDAIKIEVYRI